MAINLCYADETQKTLKKPADRRHLTDFGVKS